MQTQLATSESSKTAIWFKWTSLKIFHAYTKMKFRVRTGEQVEFQAVVPRCSSK